VIAHNGELRPAIVLLRVDLAPASKPPRGNWKETCHLALDLLQRCIYVDKDLVLPAMSKSGPGETFFVVASTDMQRVNIMLTRVREQIGALPQLQATGTVQVTAQPVGLEGLFMESEKPPMKLEERVQQVADRVTEMIKQQIEGKPGFVPKEIASHDKRNSGTR
jgi:hypothetical protein